MKVLAYCSDFCPSATFIYNGIVGLSKTNELVVVCHKRSKPKEFPYDNVRLIAKPKPNVIDYIKWQFIKRGIVYNFSNKKITKAIKTLVLEFKPDIFHLHFGPDAIYFLDNYDLRSEEQVFIHFHGYDASRMLIENPKYVKKLRLLFKKVNIHPIAVSEDMYNRMISFGLPIQKKRILYYGSDLNHFKRKENNLDEECKFFLQVSGFKEKKGHVYTLRAYKKFRDQYPEKKSKLILAGNGELFDMVKEEAKNLGLINSVEFPGFLSIYETKLLFEKADFFVHHSITDSRGDKEGIPNAIIEAMAMELPVICTLHSGIPELVEDSVHGYLIKEKDIDTYAQRMHDIFDWDKKPKNRNRVLKMFSKEVHVNKLLEFYNEVL